MRLEAAPYDRKSILQQRPVQKRTGLAHVIR
jgi:hypothetical protein